VNYSDGRSFPLFCNAGRYVQASNHSGVVNEGFSDVFGIAAEFLHQPAGTGSLRAEYRIGEDVVGAGNRAADTPAALVAMSSSLGNIPYPDHASRAFTFLVAISEGTRSNPVAFTPVPWMLVGDQLALLPFDDSGGVHVNATLISHAFYLAIEGGRNATSGITVQGVGAANRAQIERAFFRAMTVIMPNLPALPIAAQATVQAAVDLYGANGAPTVAIRQAMQAVGLLN
jgi:Zn-dependent metalloprotease